jgi:hypothetical protein
MKQHALRPPEAEIRVPNRIIENYGGQENYKFAKLKTGPDNSEDGTWLTGRDRNEVS